MTTHDADRYDFEFPDEAGYPDGKGTLSQDQVVLIDDVLETTGGPAFDFALVNDEEDGIYEAFVGDRAIGGISYTLKGNRMALHATAVYPEFRHQGIATELIRRVLDDVRKQGRTLTIMCPIVVTFIQNNPAYADLVDSAHPGVIKVASR
jgi:predicted GNAT family acetyltransferase